MQSMRCVDSMSKIAYKFSRTPKNAKNELAKVDLWRAFLSFSWKIVTLKAENKLF